MKEFLWKVRQKIQIFMQGRYGNDELNRFLCIAALVCFILSGFGGILSFLYFIGLGMLIWSLIRSLSRNIYKRQEENGKYLRWKYQITSKLNVLKERWKQRKEYKFFTCPSCHTALRVPRGRGKIKIVCRKCGTSFMGKS